MRLYGTPLGAHRAAILILFAGLMAGYVTSRNRP